MCGIAGIHRLSDRPFPELDAFAGKLLDGIEERGQDATGYVAVDDIGGIQLQKASCRAFYFNGNRAKISEQARTVLLHTRWATQGKPAFPENNHPVVSGDVYCVHNGHIWNDDELFRNSGKLRAGQVDSESIPALIASSGWEAMPKSLEEIDGDFAVALISPRQPGELVLAKGPHSPLVYIKTAHLLVWASTYTAIRRAWETTLGTPPSFKRFVYMSAGDSLMVNRDETRTEHFQTVSWRQSYTYTPAKTSNVIPFTFERDGVRVTVGEDGEEDFSPTLSNLIDGGEMLGLGAGTDLFRCEDCGDWVEGNELESVNGFGFSSSLCPLCAEWAFKVGAAEA